MPSPQKQLDQFLVKAKKIAILTIGSDLRADDGVGLLMGRLIARRITCAKPAIPLRVFHGHTAPENLTGQIRRYKPTHLILLDAIHFNRKGGAIGIVKPTRIATGSVGTHQMPMDVWIAYLQKLLPCEVLLVGIQPVSLTAMGPLSACVERSANRLCEVILRAALGPKVPLKEKS